MLFPDLLLLSCLFFPVFFATTVVLKSKNSSVPLAAISRPAPRETPASDLQSKIYLFFKADIQSLDFRRIQQYFIGRCGSQKPLLVQETLGAVQRFYFYGYLADAVP